MAIPKEEKTKKISTNKIRCCYEQQITSKPTKKNVTLVSEIRSSFLFVLKLFNLNTVVCYVFAYSIETTNYFG